MGAHDFHVTHKRLRLQVRLLPSVADVHRTYTADKRGTPLGKGAVVHGYFEAGEQDYGTIVLPMAGSDLHEIVPHEVAHAVIHHLNGVLSHDDEPCSTAIGCLCTRIFARLKKIGVAL